MRNRFAAGIAVLALAIAVTACGGSAGTGSAGTGAGTGTGGAGAGTGGPTAKPFQVGLATDTGGLNDQSFNAAANRGLQDAKTKLGVGTNVIESTKGEEYVPNLSSLADGGNDLVWGIGFLMHDAMKDVAKSHAKTKFAIIDSVVEDSPNVASVTFREQEGSFLVGVIAAKATKTKKVGFVGGIEGDLIHKFEAGFRAGVKSVDAAIQISSVYAGSFGDAPKGKQIAQQMYGAGIDVIYHASGGTGAGVIDAAKDANKFVIGVDSDQNHMAPNNVITSMIKRVDVAVFDISKKAKEGNFPGGKAVELGLAEDAVGYAPSTLWKLLPDGTQALVDKYAAAIKAGKIKVPATVPDADKFTPVQP